MFRCFATVLLLTGALSITGCDSAGDVVPDEVPAMTAAEQAKVEAYAKEQMELQKKLNTPPPGAQ